MNSKKNDKIVSNKYFLMTITAMIILLSVMSVSATAPSITWNNPTSDGTYQYQDFTLNVGTDINANCTYMINYANGTNVVSSTFFTNGVNSTSHTTSIPVSSLQAANNYNIIVTCINSTNASESTTEQKWFARDPDCGDSIYDDWTLGHDMDCLSYSGNSLTINSSLNLNGGGHIISGSTSYSGIQVLGSLGDVTITNIKIKNAKFLIGNDNSFDTNLTLTNSILSNSSNTFLFDHFNSLIINNVSFYNLTNANALWMGSTGSFLSINNSYFDLSNSNNNVLFFYQPYVVPNTRQVIISNNLFFNHTSTQSVILVQADGSSDYNFFNINNNIFNISTSSGTPVVVDLQDNITTLLFYGNSFINISHGYDLYYDGVISHYLDNGVIGNYWGHSGNICPGFFAGSNDTNSLLLLDRFPFNDADLTDKACGCGDNVISDVQLYGDVNCNGFVDSLTLNNSGVVLNCGGHTISSSLANAIDIQANNTTVTNCYLSGASTGTNGINIDHAVSYITLNNLNISSFINYGFFFNQANNVTIIDSTVNLTSAFGGIYLTNSNNVTIMHNNFIGTFSAYDLNDVSGNSNIVLDNNYWGHSSCSLFSFMDDTNSLTIIDHHPVSQQSNWSSTINCSDQTIFEGFYNATVYDGDGSTTLSNLQGSIYTYNESNEQQNISDIININGVYPWRIYSTYYYPGDQIVFDVNISPANFMFADFGIEGNSFQSYNLSITNLTGVNGTVGNYKVNISDYVFNSSDSDINGSSIPRVMNFYFRTTDYLGATRLLWINALYNFTVQDSLSSLGGNTTNWSLIPDMSDVTGFTLDLPGQGKIVFTSNVDLTDSAFISSLRNLATLIELNNGTIGLDSRELAALNVSANITFYNVSGITGLNTSTLNTTYLNNRLVVDGVICNSSVCTATNYSNTTDTFTVSVAHWTDYSIDVTAPVISGASPSGSLSSSTTSVTLEVTTDELATCKYGTTDTNYSSLTNTFDTTGALTHQETYSVSEGNSYTFYVRCKDSANNTNSASTTISFSVDSSSSSGSSSGGSSGGALTTSTIIGDTERTIELSNGGFYYFTTEVGGNNHRLQLVGKSNSSAKVSIDGVSYSLDDGSSKDIDVTNDGKSDVTLKLVELKAYTAVLSLKKVSSTPAVEQESVSEIIDDVEQTAEQDLVEETTIEDKSAETESTTTKESEKTVADSVDKTSKWWLWMIILAVFVIVLVFVVIKNTSIERV